MIAEEDDNFDPYEFQQSQQELLKQSGSATKGKVQQTRRGIVQRRPPILQSEDIAANEDCVRDAKGFLTTKDGFYLAESDDEEDVQEKTLSRKERKRKRHREQNYNSDSSTEDVLHNVVNNGTMRKPLPAFGGGSHQQNSSTKTEPRRAALETQDLSMGLSNTVNNSLKKSEQHIDEDRMRNKDKSDRATVENCLDPRTMNEIEKMINNEKLTKMFGCISTGKEANVYRAEGSMDLVNREMYAAGEDGTIPVKEYAIKIFKTSILIFKDRERYVSGEFRFRNGHCKGNPRKMVKLWAEKEVRNLKRIGVTDGVIKVPYPYILKNNIIVMEFVGENGVAAPRLRDANLDDWNQSYLQTMMIVRRLYQRCKLVHADLSEYNLLYHREEVWVIDVSQSVEHDHPMALDFLRRDCAIVQEFFQKKLERVLTTQDTFSFVTDLTIDDEHEEAVFATFVQALYAKTNEELLDEKQQDEVFKQIYIPRTLQELSLDDIDKLKRNNQEAMFNKLVGVNHNTDNPDDVEEAEEDKEEESQEPALEEEKKEGQKPIAEVGEADEADEAGAAEKEEDGSGQSGEEGENDIYAKGTVNLSEMTKEQKKEHKRRVKEENQEKRKNKVPKHIKKKAEQKNKKK